MRLQMPTTSVLEQKGEKMTDVERNRVKDICEVAGVKRIDDLSDGFHTFRQLYYQRMMLFAVIVKQNKDKAWKSLRHEDGELCFGGEWFIVGVDTPEGSYTYHYENNYFSLFDCEELERGKHWDGHTEKDVTRLLSLSPAQAEPCEDAVSRTELSHIFAEHCYPVHYDHNSVDMGMTLPGIVEVLNIAPSVTPEQKTGKAVFKSEKGFWVCNQCGERVHTWDKYCSECGAKLKGNE